MKKSLAFAAALASLVTSSAAIAQHPIDEAGPHQAFRHPHVSRTQARPCRFELRHRHPRQIRNCHGRTVSTAGKPRRVRRKDLSHWQLRLRSPSGETLAHAMKVGVVHYRSFSQAAITTNGARQLYGEKHAGGGFYDGTDVWLDDPRGGRSGYHECFPTSEILFDVTEEECAEHFQDPGGMTPYYQYWYRFNVAAAWGAINPVRFHYNVHVNLHGSGRLTFWFDDDKKGDDLP